MNCCPLCALDDEMLTMRPHPSSIMCGTTAWQQLNVPVRFTSRTRCHFSGVIDRNESTAWVPALFTRTVGRPSCSRTCVTPRSIWSRWVTSTVTPRAHPPRADLAGGRLGPSPSRSKTATANPSAASRSLMASPMPDPPPVTMATRRTPSAGLLMSPGGRRRAHRQDLPSSAQQSKEPPPARSGHQRTSYSNRSVQSPSGRPERMTGTQIYRLPLMRTHRRGGS